MVRGLIRGAKLRPGEPKTHEKLSSKLLNLGGVFKGGAISNLAAGLNNGRIWPFLVSCDRYLSEDSYLVLGLATSWILSPGETQSRFS